MPARTIHRADLSDREALLFEAGIKLGGVFHQYLGIPVSSSTSAGLARAIERAVGLQPYVASISVRIDVRRGPPLGSGRFAYRYLTPEMMDVRIRLRDGPVEVVARLAHRPELRYPLMSVDRATLQPRGRRRRATSAGRSVRTGGRSGRRTSPSVG